MNPSKWYQVDIGRFPAFELPSLLCLDCHAISRQVSCCIHCKGKNVIDLNAGSKVGDRFRHAEKLATPSSPLRTRSWDTKETVTQLISSAELYIHFSTFSIDQDFLNVIEQALSNGIQVAGLVGKPNAAAYGRIQDLNKKYAYRCSILAWPIYIFSPSSKNWMPRLGSKQDYDGPHQKFLIVDGCIALTGSMNFTNAGFAKHSRNPPSEFLWPSTDIDSVIAINNEYLSPHYVQFAPLELSHENDPTILAAGTVSVPSDELHHYVLQMRRCDRNRITRKAISHLKHGSPLGDLFPMPPASWRKGHTLLVGLELKHLRNEVTHIDYNSKKKHFVLRCRKSSGTTSAINPMLKEFIQQWMPGTVMT